MTAHQSLALAPSATYGSEPGSGDLTLRYPGKVTTVRARAEPTAMPIRVHIPSQPTSQECPRAQRRGVAHQNSWTSLLFIFSKENHHASKI